jgi:hypothetical protein
VLFTANRLAPLGCPLETGNKPKQDSRVIPDIAERLIAVEAEEASHMPSPMVMINMIRRCLAASATNAALLGQHSIEVRGIDAVAPA